MATAKQKAAARRNIKKAQAAVRRKFGRHGGHKKSHSSGGSSSGGSSTPGIGASYQAARMGVLVASPAISAGVIGAKSKSLPAAADHLKRSAWSVPYATNVVITVADAAIDKKMGQAAALSRGSATAWAPELYLMYKAARGARSGINEVLARGNLTATGFNPVDASTSFTPTDANGFVTYRLLKHGGQVARKLSSTGLGKRVLGPIKKIVLSPLGVTA